MGQMAGNIHLVNNQGPWVDKDKAETYRLTGNYIYWGDKAPRGRQKKGVKKQESLELGCNLLLIMLSLQ